MDTLPPEVRQEIYFRLPIETIGMIDDEIAKVIYNKFLHYRELPNEELQIIRKTDFIAEKFYQYYIKKILCIQNLFRKKRVFFKQLTYVLSEKRKKKIYARLFVNSFPESYLFPWTEFFIEFFIEKTGRNDLINNIPKTNTRRYIREIFAIKEITYNQIEEAFYYFVQDYDLFNQAYQAFTNWYTR